jgi:hypothetical protein
MNPAEAASLAGARLGLIHVSYWHSDFLSWNRLWPTCQVPGNEHDAADVPSGDRAAARGTQAGAKVQALPIDARNGAPNGQYARYEQSNIDTLSAQLIGDLISYRNSGKSCTRALIGPSEP